jgi:hypothetical protein
MLMINEIWIVGMFYGIVPLIMPGYTFDSFEPAEGMKGSHISYTD